jgi:virulence factor
VASIAASVHTLIEKPMALTLEQGREIVAAARDSGLVVQVGHIERFNPAYIELKNVADDLPVVALTIRRLNSFDASNKDVDVINDLMIHDIDLLLNLVGQPIERLTAYGRAIHNGATDHAVANFEFRNGPIATLIASRVTQQKVRAVDITAQNAYVEGDLLSKSLVINRRVYNEYVGGKYRQESVTERIHIPVAEPLMLQLQHFIGCIRDKRTPDVPAEDGLRAMEVAAEISGSIRAGSYLAAEAASLDGMHPAAGV